MTPVPSSIIWRQSTATSIPFESFAAARDWLYLAAMLVGAAVAAAVRALSPRIGALRRARLSSVCFTILAFAIAAAGLAFIESDGAVLMDRSLHVAALCIAIFSIAALCFPRAVGFPCVVGIGAAVAIIGYCFLSLPPADEASAVGLLVFGENKAVSVRFGKRDILSDEAEGLFFLPIKIETIGIRFHLLWPAFGGEERVVLRSVRFGSENSIHASRPLPIELFVPPDEDGVGTRLIACGIYLNRISTEFTPERVTVGTRLSVYPNGIAIRIGP